MEIQAGNLTARVIGDSSVPFKVSATIKPLPEDKIDEAVSLATGKIQNIDALVAGDFPEDLLDLLLPRPDDVDLTCNCPDFSYNYICPHTSAFLYGIGVRIDRDPLLLFEIRGIDADKFIFIFVFPNAIPPLCLKTHGGYAVVDGFVDFIFCSCSC